MYLYIVREMLVFANMAAVRNLTLCQTNLAFQQPQHELAGNLSLWFDPFPVGARAIVLANKSN